MAETAKKSAAKTPRQAEIARLAAKGAAKRSEQESARLDQLRKAERRERFLRLAPKRVQNLLESARRLSACGNRAGYDYTEAEVERIIGAVDAAIGDVRKSFAARKYERERFAL